MFKSTVTKWPIQKQTHRTRQKHVHVEHQDERQTKLISVFPVHRATHYTTVEYYLWLPIFKWNLL